jgi:phenylacetic acid degradation operon negative regulatory protein
MAVAARAGLRHFRAVVLDAPVSYFVYSAFSFYASRRGGELPGTWLVAAGRALGHEVPAIRQTLYRMEGIQELVSRAVGRSRIYRLTPAAQQEAEAGLAKIMEVPSAAWDRNWTLVHFNNPEDERVEKDRLRSVLRAEGFARLGPGLFVHPRDRSARLLTALRASGVDGELEIFRGKRVELEDDHAFVQNHWDLSDLAAQYRAFLSRYEPLARHRSLRPEDAFLLRFALVFEYLEIAWTDPDLPAALLPSPWPGAEAQQLARQLYRRFLPGAMAFGDRIAGEVRERKA